MAHLFGNQSQVPRGSNNDSAINQGANVGAGDHPERRDNNRNNDRSDVTNPAADAPAHRSARQNDDQQLRYLIGTPDAPRDALRNTLAHQLARASEVLREAGFTEREVQALQEGQSEITCGNCAKKGHTILHCIWPAIDGYVHGCVWCNTRWHELRECPKPVEWNRRVKMALVRTRAKRPQLAGYPEIWADIAALAGEHERGMNLDIEMPRTFPWSQTHPETLVYRGNRVWETFDYSDPRSASGSIVDVKTKDLDMLHVQAFPLQAQQRPLRWAPIMVKGTTNEQLQHALRCHKLLL